MIQSLTCIYFSCLNATAIHLGVQADKRKAFQSYCETRQQIYIRVYYADGDTNFTLLMMSSKEHSFFLDKQSSSNPGSRFITSAIYFICILITFRFY